MEWLRQMNLRKSLFLVTASSIVVGLILYFVAMFAISRAVPVCQCEDCGAAASGYLGLALPFALSVGMPLVAAAIFYQVKLKKPLQQLHAGANKIRANDLNFSVDFHSQDELGQLCQSFEAMRQELLKTSQALWQQMEERKRLNAAFAHDLRNPVAVLKGSAMVLEKALETGHPDQAQESISLIAQYAQRIENYIQGMTTVQKLEELSFAPKPTHWEPLCKELKTGLQILANNAQKTITVTYTQEDILINIDRYILQNVVENLVANALRYCQSTVRVNMTLHPELIEIAICDDGPGFGSLLLKSGIVPFLKKEMEEDIHSSNQHFGMGLYICQLLCEKHGGHLRIANQTTGGARVLVALAIK